MKALKKIGIGLIMLPLILIVIYILFELVGMCVNHISTDRQTDKLQSTLSAAVSDIDIINAKSWTGNTGNGNHVECVSEVTFTSTMDVEDIAAAFSDKNDKDVSDSYMGAEGSYFLVYEDKGISSVRFSINENGNCLCRMVKSAPFSDNIEGH